MRIYLWDVDNWDDVRHWDGILQTLQRLITSDANIKIVNNQQVIVSNADIVVPNKQQLITSNANVIIKNKQQTITSDANVEVKKQQLITSNANVIIKNKQQTITSNANVEIKKQQLITSNAQIGGHGQGSITTGRDQKYYTQSERSKPFIGSGKPITNINPADGRKN